MFFQASLERSETETRQRLNNQLEKQEREISQLQKRLEHEAEQRHLLSRNQEVRQNLNGCVLLSAAIKYGLLIYIFSYLQYSTIYELKMASKS